MESTDDLLIVRMSDRAKRRRHDRSLHAPLGANLGLVFAAAFGFLIFAKWGELNGDSDQAAGAEPLLALAIVGAICIVLFSALGRALKLRRRLSPFHSKRHYQGLPHDHAAPHTDGDEAE